jgi:hypothetical protein
VAAAYGRKARCYERGRCEGTARVGKFFAVELGYPRVSTDLIRLMVPEVAVAFGVGRWRVNRAGGLGSRLEREPRY